MREIQTLTYNRHEAEGTDQFRNAKLHQCSLVRYAAGCSLPIVVASTSIRATFAWRLPEEVTKAGWCQLSVFHRVLNIAVPQIALQRPRIMPRIGQGVAGCVAQHMRVGLETQFGGFTSPLDHAREASGGEGRAALAGEHERRRWILLPLKPTQRPQLVTHGLDGRRAPLGSANVQGRTFQPQ